MRIDIYDDNQNWLNWGNLVNSWISGAETPTTVGALKRQLAANHVTATVQGPDNRAVSIESYGDYDPADALVIVIPTAAMRAAKAVGPGRYPLPLFYDIAFAGAARANLSTQEAQDFALRRIGEYTVNECC